MILEYGQQVGDAHRKSFGQFFTHPKVAEFMVRWVLGSGGKTVFDPAFGLGAFRTAAPSGVGIGFSGFEVDPDIIRFWEKRTGENADFIARKDYLLSWGQRHANIVCNPPYMRFQKFLNREAVFREFQRHLGIGLSGYTNIASAFLLKSLSELGRQGRLAYIMPLEFLNTGYGAAVKRRLMESGHLFAMLRFDCEKEIFPDATTSVGLVLYDKAVTCSSVRFYTLRSILDLDTFDEMAPVAEVPCEELDPEAKWSPLFQRREFEVDRARMAPLASFGRFVRGIATGANEFFVLRPSVARERGIAPGFECVPCITRSAQVRRPVFDPADYDALYDSDGPVLLFSVDGSLSRAASEYIRFGERSGFDGRFLTRNRKPWYRTESRSPSPLLLGVFSRGGYKIVLNRSRALNLTCFHGFQPNLFGHRYVEHLFLYFSSKTGRRIVSLFMRKYGDSLDKFEPNDLNQSLVPAPDFFASIPAAQVTEAVAVVRKTRQLPQWAEGIFVSLATHSASAGFRSS